jgi:hypothetical protein
MKLTYHLSMIYGLEISCSPPILTKKFGHGYQTFDVISLQDPRRMDHKSHAQASRHTDGGDGLAPVDRGQFSS